jgi:hypothetical protein
MTDQNEQLTERLRALKRINHLIESGYLPRELVDDLKNLIRCVEENGTLKKALADQLLEKAMKP